MAHESLSGAAMTSKPLDAIDLARVELARKLQSLGYQFTTITPLSHHRVNARPENQKARDLRGIFGWSRPFTPEIVAPEVWEWMQKAEVAAPDGDLWRPLVRISSLDGLLFFHSPFPTDEADAIFFGPDTYRFARALQNGFSQLQEVKRAVDIGCGAGPGAILAARAFPEAEIFATDINQTALRFTQLNAALAGVQNLETRCSDLLADLDGQFDLMMANPPYLVDDSERAYRHGGGSLGAELSLKIVETALERLAPGGTLLLYTGVAMVDGRDPFREEVAARLDGALVSWKYEEMDVDIFGEELENAVYSEAERIAAVVLTAKN